MIGSDPNSTPSTNENNGASHGARPLRLWLAFVILAIQFLIMFGPGFLSDLNSVSTGDGSDVQVESSLVDNPQLILNSKLLGPLIGTLLLLIWWIAFSGASWLSRLVAPILLVGVGWATWQLIDSTMLFAFVMFMVPCATLPGFLLYFFFERLNIGVDN